MQSGRRYDLYAIGHVAQALERSASTIRRWERDGAIPKASYSIKGRDVRGNRRLYSRRQVNLLVEAATVAGLYGKRTPTVDQIVSFGAFAYNGWSQAAVLTDADLTENARVRAEMVQEE
jgi:hypothetical protein